MTFSVGMRAPSRAELLVDFAEELAADADEALRYADPDLAPAADAFEIDDAALRRVVEALNALRMNDADRVGDWFGRFITRYRSAGEVAAPGGDCAPASRSNGTCSQGAPLLRHPWSRMAWRQAPARAARAVRQRPATLVLPAARRCSDCHGDRHRRRDVRRAVARPAATRCIELLGAGHYQLRTATRKNERR